MGEKYRVVEGYTVSHADGVYEEGDEFEADEVTARALGERRGVIEPVDSEAAVGSARSTELTGEVEGEVASPSVDEDYDVPAEAEDEDDVGYESSGESESESEGEGDGNAAEGAETAAEVEDEAEAQADDEDAPPDYDSLTVGELEDALKERDFSQAELEDLLAYEKENKDRTGAKDAIEARL